MSARLANIVTIVAIAAATAVAGCAAPQLDKATALNSAANSVPGDAATNSSDQDIVAQFDEAVAMVADLQYEAALPKLLTVGIELEAAGDRARAAEAMFWLGFCHEKLRHDQDAMDTYTRIIRDYPATTAAKEAGARLTRFAPETR